MRTSTQEVVKWLNDAHAMELALAEVLESHATAAKNAPDIGTRLSGHAAETRVHAERIKRAISLAGANLSTGKAWLGDMMGRLDGLISVMPQDATVKNCLLDYAAEQFEIACYTSLIAAAESVSLPQVAALCRQNLDEEQAMAQWLQARIPEVTLRHLERVRLREAA